MAKVYPIRLLGERVDDKAQRQKRAERVIEGEAPAALLPEGATLAPVIAELKSRHYEEWQIGEA